jgi:hypothetical protein
MRTSELTGVALDWAVHYAMHGECEGYSPYEYSTDWAYGGPIIERERLWVGYSAVGQSLRLVVMEDAVVQCHKRMLPPQPKSTTGPTILIAAMRCYVVSKLGNEIEIPTELEGVRKC